MAERDQLEGQIDDKMVALFNRLKQLEDANLSLEQVTACTLCALAAPSLQRLIIDRLLRAALL